MQHTKVSSLPLNAKQKIEAAVKRQLVNCEAEKEIEMNCLCNLDPLLQLVNSNLTISDGQIDMFAGCYILHGRVLTMERLINFATYLNSCR